jgi:hypothetical protein
MDLLMFSVRHTEIAKKNKAGYLSNTIDSGKLPERLIGMADVSLALMGMTSAYDRSYVFFNRLPFNPASPIAILCATKVVPLEDSHSSHAVQHYLAEE